MIDKNSEMKEALNYFNGDELAAKVFIDKYALRDNEGTLLEKTPKEMFHRIASEFARIEEQKFKNTSLKPLTYNEIYELIDNFKYIVPQGSPLFGIGNSFVDISLANCFVVPSPEDSYGSIMKTDENIVQICKRRGGVGLDMSKLRPTGAKTKNAAKTSTGVPSFMERFSNSIREVGQSGRRGALMLSLRVDHPDIEEFITIKNDRTKVTGANVSIRVTDKFLNAVEHDELYELYFDCNDGSRISKNVSAKKIWDLIIKNAWEHAEPGVLFWDTIINNSPADCYKQFGYETVSTNPCSEIAMSEYESCRLLLLNLFSFVDNPFTDKASFDYDKFERITIIAQRLMDDLIDLEIEKIDGILNKINRDPEEDGVKSVELALWNDIKKKAIEGRRTGLGITALGDVFATLNTGYGTPDSFVITDNIFRALRNSAYKSSIELAEVLGPFPIYDFELEKNNDYILRLKSDRPDLYEKMTIHGRRNIALLTVAPAGSISLLTQTTSGFEPLFMTSYTRRTKISNDLKNSADFVDDKGDCWKEYKVLHPKLQMFTDINGDKSVSPYQHFTADKIDWQNRVKLQGIAQQYIDHSISSTENIPEDTPVSVVDEIYRTAWKSGCKGITIYRQGSRSGILIDDSKAKEKVQVTENHAIKRPSSLETEVHHIKAKKIDYYVAIGLLNGKPYEI
jgi:ribonucleoside-diphosphate reductase alpha chain